MALTIAQAVRSILVKEPFYGLFLLGLNKYFDNTIPTACVRRRGINVELAINENYWNSVDDKYKIGIVLHETLHILYKHLWMQESFDNKERFNIAADCHVNSFLWDVHPDWYHPKDFGLEVGQGTKYYYDNLPENQEYNPFDVHSWEDFKNLSDSEKQLIENQIDYQAKSAAEQVMKSCGKIPGHLSEYIKNLFKKRDAVFNWKRYFKRVVGNSIKSYIKKTRYKPSYRFKGQPGNILKFKPKVLVAIDTSGSINNDELSDFFTEVNHLYKSGVCIEVVEFDTQIQNKFVYKGQNTDIKIVGRGGTDMSDVYTLYTTDSSYSTLVIFTDGYMDTDYPRHKNMVWVISSNGAQKEYPGIVVYIPKK